METFCLYKPDFSTAQLEVMHIIVFHKEMHKNLTAAKRPNVFFALGKLWNICDALFVGAGSIIVTVITKMASCC